MLKSKNIINIFILLIIVFVILLNMTFPLFYEKEVTLYSDIFNVDKYSVYAIIKAESNFNKNAISEKNAKGLMQLLDQTAEEIFDELNVSEEYRDLYNPESNIMAGTYYFSRLLELFDNNEEKAIAAYNSGMGNVREWINREGEFRDNILFEETSNYLTKVETYKFVYHTLYETLKLGFLTLPDIFVNLYLLIRNFIKYFRRLFV